jgi:hypothetical protein
MLKIAHIEKPKNKYDEETRALAEVVARELMTAYWQRACKKYNKPLPEQYQAELGPGQETA